MFLYTWQSLFTATDGMTYYSVAVVKGSDRFGSGAGAGTQMGSGLLGANACFPGTFCRHIYLKHLSFRSNFLNIKKESLSD